MIRTLQKWFQRLLWASTGVAQIKLNQNTVSITAIKIYRLYMVLFISRCHLSILVLQTIRQYVIDLIMAALTPPLPHVFLPSSFQHFRVAPFLLIFLWSASYYSNMSLFFPERTFRKEGEISAPQSPSCCS